MKKDLKKLFRVITYMLVVIVFVSFISYLIQSNYFKLKQTPSTSSSNKQFIDSSITNQPQSIEPEDEDVYSQRQLRADENNSLDTSGLLRTSNIVLETEQELTTYHVGSNQITTNNGITVSTVIYNQGNYIKGHYGYSEYNPSPKSSGIYADVVISLENISKAPKEINMTKINFVDQFNRVFTPIKNEGSCGVQNIVAPTNINELLIGTGPKSVNEITGNLNPNVPCSVRILFEVASSSLPKHIEFFSN